MRTPALDRLAREGTRFELTYAANPVCVPSRYSLLTGHLPHRFGGLETNQQSNGKPLPAITDWVSTPPMGQCLRTTPSPAASCTSSGCRRSRPRWNSGSAFAA